MKPEHTAKAGHAGDVLTWVAIDAETKLIPCWLIGRGDANAARDFMEDLAGRLSNRIQLTTDGLKIYANVVKDAFANDIDYAMLVKAYGLDPQAEKRYSPSICLGCERRTVTGRPDPDHMNTSYVERQNLTMRMSMRRYTRLTNGFSKKIANHVAMVAPYMMAYNFQRVHKTLGSTPAVKAGIAKHVWSINEIVGLLETRQELAA